METNHLKYLQRLSEIYPSIAAASTEIINLSSILNLPKGTEHFITDVHGEFEAFSHVLKNGSGSVREKIEEVFGNMLSEEDKKELATLIYYPLEKTALVRRSSGDKIEDWYRVMLYRLLDVCKHSASKYTRSKVRKALPKDFAYVIEELITEKSNVRDKEKYYEEIINTIIRIGRADVFIAEICELIQTLVIDHLHILGDIFDRGSGADDIMERLMSYHRVDFQWGNHDVLWMGAATGQLCCIANVVRICARYGNLDTLEDGYGINLLPLATLAGKIYENDPCTCFRLKGEARDAREEEIELNIKIHKAISVIQFKLEGELVHRRRQFKMEDRAMLERIDYEAGTVDLAEGTFPMLDTNFPTIDPEDPYRLTEEEQYVVDRLQTAFLNCGKLERHMKLLLNQGALYKVINGNLLYHGCVPLDDKGEFREVSLYDGAYKGKELYDHIESYVRKAFFSMDLIERERGRDILWWLWCSSDSPLFGKDKIATFERYFVADRETHVETKDVYYSHLEDPKVVDAILQEFGVSGEHTHIINGHVPVKVRKGESPMRCDGKVLVIDGGFSKAYQDQTGIAGYTLVYNSHGMKLVAHEAFTSAEDAIRRGSDMHSQQIPVWQAMDRLCVSDTDNGDRLRERIEELEELLAAYQTGRIVERAK